MQQTTFRVIVVRGECFRHLNVDMHLTCIVRFSFFGHLIDVLGSSDFLAPVCMLLADKMANRVTRQNLEDSVNTLALPLSVLQRYPKEIQLSVSKIRNGLLSCLELVSRLSLTCFVRFNDFLT